MLTIFRTLDEIPEGIKFVKDNDAYFNAKSKLSNTDLVKLVLGEIDGAEYVSENIFLGRNRNLGGLNKMLLSTGSKTLINIINSDKICFDVIECGINALDLLPKISCCTDGYILWEYCLYPFAKNYPCDIIYHGKHFYRIFDFTTEISEEDCNDSYSRL